MTPPPNPSTENDRSGDRLVAYLLWLVFGLIGAHRYYWRKKNSAIAMSALFILGVPLVLFGIVSGALAMVISSSSGALSGVTMTLLGMAFGAINVLWWLIDAFLIPFWDTRGA